MGGAFHFRPQPRDAIRLIPENHRIHVYSGREADTFAESDCSGYWPNLRRFL